MASINKVILIGNLGKDPETRYMPNGDAVTTITMATTDTWKDKAGEKQEKTEWHRVVFYRKIAEIAGEFLRKGASVYIEGKLETRKWTDKAGVERYTTQIISDEMKMLGSKSGSTSHEPVDENYQEHPEGKPVKKNQTPAGTGFEDMSDDIPF